MFAAGSLLSQGETNKWYFGNQAGLDFNTSTPTPILTSGMVTSWYSSSSICDAAGNILFYTNGATVYDQTNAIMANGSGLNGNTGNVGSQKVIIIKKPGSSTIYYIFHTLTFNSTTVPSGLFYSEVNMSLASGNGSVTAKNVPILTGIFSSITSNTVTVPSKMTATRHCNGTDIWLVTRDWWWNTSAFSGTTSTINNFRAFQISSAGINTTAIVSSPVTYTFNNNFGTSNDYGCMKISPNGKKLAAALYYNNGNQNNNNGFELFDFDNTTGVVSNSLALVPNPTGAYNYGWGVEFSPDGTKLYGTNFYTGSFGSLLQWDLCAGSPTAIVASIYTVAIGAASGNQYMYALQMASNGKIYLTRNNTLQTLDVINTPNALGAACAFSVGAQSTAPKNTNIGLPNFMTSYFIQHPPPTPFTHTVSPAFGCQTASFNCLYTPSVSVVGCSATGYSVTSMLWNFGDPVTGTANTSTLTNPYHAYSSLGTYTAQLVLYYSCGGGTDTIRQTVNVNVPCISVTSSSITCSSLGSATVVSLGGVGPFSFTWTPSAQSGSVATGLSPGVYTLTVHDFGNNFTYTASTTFNSLIPLTGNLAYSPSVTCNGAQTGTATVTNIAGGSGTQNYVWTGPSSTLSAASPTNLGAGTWNLLVTDALTGCQINQTFFITQPTGLTLNLSSSTPTACAGGSIALSSTVSGGTPGTGYTYAWIAGPLTDTYTASQSLGGNYVYTLTAKDSYSCLTSNTIGVTFVNNPVLSVPNVSICPQQTATLHVTGATTYTWNSGSNPTGSTFTDNPLSTTQYTVSGEALGCISNTVGNIILKAVPVPTLSSNSPLCNGQSLHLHGLGGVTYAWSGPPAFIPAIQNPTLNNATPNNSGTYNATLTAANNCTALASINITVNPTPTLSATSGTVCVTQTLNLTVATFTGSTYQWHGPNSFVSTQQNPSIIHPTTQATGAYSVQVTSAAGCTNTAVTNASIVALPVPSYSSNSPRCFGSSLVFNASATTGGTSYSWTGPNSFASSVQNPTITNVTVPAAGLYTLVVTTGPCAISYIAQPVVINPLPALTLGNTGPVCEGKPIQLTATGSGTAYAWSGPSFSFAGQVISFPTASLSNSGNYTVVTSDANSCITKAVMPVSILTNPVITAAGSTVCLNDPSTVTASGAASYAWTGPSGYISHSSSGQIPVTTPAAVGMYIVTAQAVNGCTTVAMVNVAIQPLPQPSLEVTPTVCVNSLITLKGFGGHTYVWNGPANFMSASQSVTFTAFSRDLSGSYSLTAIDSIGCKNSINAPVTIYEGPDGSLLSTQNNHCVPFCSDFKLAPNAPVLNTVWEVAGRSYASETFRYCFNTADRYIIRGTFTGAYCTSSSTFAVDAYAAPVANFGYLPEKPVESTDQVIFTNTSQGNNLKTWSWSIRDNVSNYTTRTENASYLFNNTGVYPVAMVVSSAEGCSDTIIKLVNILPDFNVFVPNTFTPNDDGRNELFMPVTRNVSQLSFAIYDRWGEKLFSTTNPESGWDGTYKGQDCKQDVYVWKITVTGKNSEQKHLTGSVNLIR